MLLAQYSNAKGGLQQILFLMVGAAPCKRWHADRMGDKGGE
jgi:hypothetical protein